MQTNDTLELWTTVETVVQEIKFSGQEISLKSVKGVIAKDKEWKKKLKKSFFSDNNIKAAIAKSKELFG
jgi:hypothetical protein